MKKSIDISIIKEKSDKLKGTTNYQKYNMECYSKVGRKWCFMGWGVPFQKKATLQKIKDNYYLHCGEYRYTVNDSVNNLLKIY